MQDSDIVKGYEYRKGRYLIIEPVGLMDALRRSVNQMKREEQHGRTKKQRGEGLVSVKASKRGRRAAA